MSPFLVFLRFIGYGADWAPISEYEKEIVMKNIATIALFIATTFIAAGSAPAQDHLVKATVPFSFTVGDQTLPSGTYSIGSGVNPPYVLAIRNSDKNVSILTLARPDQDNHASDNTLVFHRYGNQYFLSQIRSDGASMNIHFPTSKAEKRAKTQVEEAGRFVNDPVLLALK